MRDVTIDICIKWAYGIQESQVTGPALVRKENARAKARAFPVKFTSEKPS